jgi:hypothetical protein
VSDYDSDKWQTPPLVREGALHRKNHNCLTVTKIWSWAQDEARHQDELTDRRSRRDFDFGTKKKRDALASAVLRHVTIRWTFLYTSPSGKMKHARTCSTRHEAGFYFSQGYRRSARRLAGLGGKKLAKRRRRQWNYSYNKHDSPRVVLAEPGFEADFPVSP